MGRRSDGFTLAELLIVTAILAVLAGLCVPVFAGRLELARDYADAVSVRQVYVMIRFGSGAVYFSKKDS